MPLPAPVMRTTLSLKLYGMFDCVAGVVLGGKSLKVYGVLWRGGSGEVSS
jgi:hypothetical protein